jgi:hypothetical protein
VVAVAQCAKFCGAQMPTPAQCCGQAGPSAACPGGSASGAGSFCNKGPTGKNVLFLAADGAQASSWLRQWNDA